MSDNKKTLKFKVSAAEVVARAGNLKSKSAASALIKQKSVKLNGKPITNPGMRIECQVGSVLRINKKTTVRIAEPIKRS